MNVRRSILPVALLSAASIAVWALWSTPKSSRPNVFVFTVDTLRADHTSVYGYGRETTPWLGQLASRAVVYEHCASSSSWTVPSLATLHTGQHAWTLGVHAAPSLRARGKAGQSEHPVLPKGVQTLAEQFQGAGYSTHGLTANGHLVPLYGWNRGFDSYANVGWGSVDAVERRLKGLSRSLEQADGPHFIWIHLFDPHDPYFRVPESGWSGAVPGYEATHGPLSLTTSKMEARPDLVQGEGLELLLGLYDGEILDADHWLAHAADVLGVTADDVVLFASDHGEEFQERGHFGHRRSLYEESVHVPCMLMAPGIDARREPGRVGLIDMNASVLAAAGIETGSLGRDVRAQVEPGAVISHLMRGEHESWAVYLGNDKQITTPEGIQRFDLAADPTETRPLAPSPTLTEVLEELRLAYPAVRGEAVESAGTAELEALGYIDPAKPE